MKISKSFRFVILFELIFPIALLTLGIYHGLMQTIYRSGLIHSAAEVHLDYYQGLTLHGVINAIVLTTFFGVAFGNVYVSQQLESPLSLFGSALTMILMLL